MSSISKAVKSSSCPEENFALIFWYAHEESGIRFFPYYSINHPGKFSVCNIP